MRASKRLGPALSRLATHWGLRVAGSAGLCWALTCGGCGPRLEGDRAPLRQISKSIRPATTWTRQGGSTLAGQAAAFPRQADAAAVVTAVEKAGPTSGRRTRFYRTRGFFAAIWLTSLLGVYGWHRVSLRRQRARHLRDLGERDWASRDFHDYLSQNLIAASRQLELAMAAESQVAALPGGWRDHLGLVVRILQESLREIGRTVSDEQRTGPDARTLREGLRGLLNEQAPPDRPNLILHISPQFDLLRPSLRRELQRMVQEAFLNSLRHAQARTVLVRLTLPSPPGTPVGVVFEVRDNGRGFLPDAQAAGGASFGLLGLRARGRAAWRRPARGEFTRTRHQRGVHAAHTSGSPFV